MSAMRPAPVAASRLFLMNLRRFCMAMQVVYPVPSYQLLISDFKNKDYFYKQINLYQT